MKGVEMSLKLSETDKLKKNVTNRSKNCSRWCYISLTTYLTKKWLSFFSLKQRTLLVQKRPFRTDVWTFTLRKYQERKIH